MNQQNNIYKDDEIDLIKIISILWNKKILIITVTCVFAIASIFFALSLPNVYTSRAVLAPIDNDDSLFSSLGAYSSLASIGGISLPNESATRTDEAIERIKSFEFFSKYILPNVNLEDIIAVESWNSSSNKIEYKSKLYDQKNKKWVRKASYPQRIIPSEQEAFKSFSKVLNIGTNKENPFISISIQHQSPYLAKEWLEIIIYNINESMRLEDVKISETYINFLNETQKNTNIQSLREVISDLLENQMQTLMLASSNESYIFKTIDSPIVPEKKSGPSRSVICILGTLFGGILSLGLALIQNYRENLKLQD